MPDLKELEITFDTIATITEKLSQSQVEIVLELQRLSERIDALERNQNVNKQ